MQARLTRADRLSKVAAEAARMGTWQLDVASGKLDCSDDFLTLIGVQRATWAGTAAALEALVHPEDVAGLRRFYVEASQTGRLIELEFRIHKLDGGGREAQT